MTNSEALEKLYRQECISLPEQCGNCEKGKQSKCELYECYVQLRDAIKILEALKRNVGIRIAIQEWANKEAKVFPNDRKIVKEWLEK